MPECHSPCIARHQGQHRPPAPAAFPLLLALYTQGSDPVEGRSYPPLHKGLASHLLSYRSFRPLRMLTHFRIGGIAEKRQEYNQEGVPSAASALGSRDLRRHKDSACSRTQPLLVAASLQYQLRLPWQDRPGHPQESCLRRLYPN